MYSDPLSWQHGLIGALLLTASLGVFAGSILVPQLMRLRRRHHR